MFNRYSAELCVSIIHLFKARIASENSGLNWRNNSPVMKNGHLQKNIWLTEHLSQAMFVNFSVILFSLKLASNHIYIYYMRFQQHTGSDNFNVEICSGIKQQPQDVESMLVYRWSTVYDARATLNQHWFNVFRLLCYINLWAGALG